MEIASNTVAKQALDATLSVSILSRFIFLEPLSICSYRMHAKINLLYVLHTYTCPTCM